MKLLLVEDERLTREGIIKAINWHDLGIGEVREAIDGLDALEIAGHYQPDIIVTDVRMPRMDGVEAAFQLRRLYPHSKIIFLSGYADKQYLKAAISLQAVGYVEKPIDIEEVGEAIRHAVVLCLADKRLLEQDAAAKETIQRSSSFIQQEVALELLRKGDDKPAILHRLGLAGVRIPAQERAVSIVVKFTDVAPPKEQLQSELDKIAPSGDLIHLFAQKDDHHAVLHLISGKQASLSPPAIRSFCKRLSNRLKEMNAPHCMAAGHVASDLLLLYESYMTAVMQLQECFYWGPYSVAIHAESSTRPVYPADPNLPKRLRLLLEEGNLNEAYVFINNLTQEIQCSPGTLVVTVKELYFRLILELEQFARQRHLELFSSGSTDSMRWDLVSCCNYLHQVQELVRQTFANLKKALNERGAGSTAAKIMTYIHRHYTDDDLSVTGISSEMQMTASHLIAIFKETTGTTVKQYLMEFRIEKAKQLLIDHPKLKVADIASQVGYKDGEHFAKMFKKFVGITPSEYRERFAL